jgi:hypothetical protein
LQQLHLVGFTTDLEGLIFAARRGAKSGGFVVAIDDELLEAIDDAFERRATDDGEEPDAERRPLAALHRRTQRVESTLTPREIQARLRAGRSISDVARAAGVDEDWVSRFAAPIQAEQAQVITRVRSLVYSKQRLGPSAQPLGTAVLWNLRDKGVAVYDDTFDQGWTAFHVRDSEWIVRFGYVNRKKAQHAEWLVDLVDGDLTSRNRLGSELAYVEPGRRRRPVITTDGPAPPPPPADGRSNRGIKTSNATPRRASSVSRPTPRTRPTKTSAKKTSAKKAATKKSATKKAATKKSATKKAATKRAGSSRPAAKKTTLSNGAKRSSSSAKKSAPRKATARKAAPRKTATKRSPSKRTAATRAGSRSPAPAPAPTATPNQPLSRRERRAQRIPPSTTAAPRVAVNPVVANPTPRSFVPTPSERPTRRPVRADGDEWVPTAPAQPLPEPASQPASEVQAQPEPERPVPVIVIDDADSSVRRISSRNQPTLDGEPGRAVTIRAPVAASSLPPPAPGTSRRFGRRRGRAEVLGDDSETS